MNETENNYLINNPIFVKYKSGFDLSTWKRTQYLKSVFINERIIEIPFAIQSLSVLPQGSLILDLGCMESVLPLQMAGLGYNVTGLDFRAYPYIHPNLFFVRGDILQLPFREESFDAVVSVSTIEHIGIGFYADPMWAKEADHRAAAEAARVLNKGGMFVITIPYGVPQVNEHCRIYDEPALRHLLKGFSIQETRYFTSSKTDRSRSNF